MMASSKPETGLVGRLGRLTDSDGDSCLPRYQKMGSDIVKTRQFAATLARARALADEQRLTVVAILRREGELCGCEIQAALGITHATVSHHMSILTSAGLVNAVRRGKWMYLSTDPRSDPGGCMSGPEEGEEVIRQSVRERYGGLAREGGSSCCGDGESSCGGSSRELTSPRAATGCCAGGYTDSELASLPEGSNLGLGCGNPTQLVPLRPGEVVLDLGSGAGVDCFLAAKKVGPSGRVIGVDMTPEMVSRARGLARSSGRTNVEFRLGEIEHLPVEDASVDVVLSNCVINLVPDKGQVYREAFRVLRPGGRLAVADVLATRPISEGMRNDPDRWASCSSGALTVQEVTDRLRSAGFEAIEVSVLAGDPSGGSLRAQDEIGVVPGEVRATKPGGPHP